MSNRCENGRNRRRAEEVEIAGVNAVDVPGVVADRKEEAQECCTRRSEDFDSPVCISVDKVYDACRERNCIVDSRVYVKECDQDVIDNAINVKLKEAEIIWVYTDIEPVLYSSGYYSIDIKFFIDVTLEVFCGLSRPTEIHGLTTFDKRVLLYGSEGSTKSFKSTFEPGGNIEKVRKSTNLPKVTVEAVDPIVLSARLSEEDCGCGCNCGCSADIPETISDCYEQELVTSDCVKKVLVSMGLFSIVRIERNVQLLVDAIDFCIPEGSCTEATAQEPCELFNQVRFPIDEFFPPSSSNDFANISCGNGNSCGCGCGCRG